MFSFSIYVSERFFLIKFSVIIARYLPCDFISSDFMDPGPDSRTGTQGQTRSGPDF